jgi:hypothetical protein
MALQTRVCIVQFEIPESLSIISRLARVRITFSIISRLARVTSSIKQEQFAMHCIYNGYKPTL